MWLPLTCPHTRDLAHNPGMCPDWESNQRSFGPQAGALSTEPHQPGLSVFNNGGDILIFPLCEELSSTERRVHVKCLRSHCPLVSIPLPLPPPQRKLLMSLARPLPMPHAHMRLCWSRIWLYRLFECRWDVTVISCPWTCSLILVCLGCPSCHMQLSPILVKKSILLQKSYLGLAGWPDW